MYQHDCMSIIKNVIKCFVTKNMCLPRVSLLMIVIPKRDIKIQ